MIFSIGISTGIVLLIHRRAHNFTSSWGPASRMMGTGDDFYHPPGQTVGFRSCVWTDRPTDRPTDIMGTDDLHHHPGRTVEVTDDQTMMRNDATMMMMLLLLMMMMMMMLIFLYTHICVHMGVYIRFTYTQHTRTDFMYICCLLYTSPSPRD